MREILFVNAALRPPQFRPHSCTACYPKLGCRISTWKLELSSTDGCDSPRISGPGPLARRSEARKESWTPEAERGHIFWYVRNSNHQNLGIKHRHKQASLANHSNLNYDPHLCIFTGSNEAAFWGMGSPPARIRLSFRGWKKDTPLSSLSPYSAAMKNCPAPEIPSLFHSGG